MDKDLIDATARKKIDHFARGRNWKLLQVRPDDYLVVIGKDWVWAVKRAE